MSWAIKSSWDCITMPSLCVLCRFRNCGVSAHRLCPKCSPTSCRRETRGDSCGHCCIWRQAWGGHCSYKQHSAQHSLQCDVLHCYTQWYSRPSPVSSACLMILLLEDALEQASCQSRKCFYSLCLYVYAFSIQLELYHTKTAHMTYFSMWLHHKHVPIVGETIQGICAKM